MKLHWLTMYVEMNQWGNEKVYITGNFTRIFSIDDDDDVDVDEVMLLLSDLSRDKKKRSCICMVLAANLVTY